jgi:hypothetical protein
VLYEKSFGFTFALPAWYRSHIFCKYSSALAPQHRVPDWLHALRTALYVDELGERLLSPEACISSSKVSAFLAATNPCPDAAQADMTAL